MSVKIDFLHLHVDFTLENLGLVSEEQKDWFHQGIKDMECKYQGRMDKSMIADYCWLLNEIGLRLNIKEERQKGVTKEKRMYPRINFRCLRRYRRIILIGGSTEILLTKDKGMCSPHYSFPGQKI
ncbi:hypothetical protein TNCV_4240951 [Trichonephila clavipes]|nr:hypothetical protein TNCV_4240951 [Trichonephila clavipes]